MAHDVLVVTEADLRRAVALDLTAVDAVEQAFAALAAGKMVMPPILAMAIAEANGEVDVKSAYIPGLDSLAVKISPGFFDNPQIGLPSVNGLMVLLSARTGLVEAVFLDNGYLTNVRTAAAGAVAARYMAPAEVETAGVMGAGVQAHVQIEAAHLVRPFRRVLVWSRELADAETCAADLADRLGVEARAEADPARLVAESQLVVTATPARAPILMADWLHPRLHITAMGSDQSEKNEIDPHAIVAADAYVCDRVSQCETLGELRSVIAAGLWKSGPPQELGAVVVGRAVARKHEDDVTICDLTGTGAQDTAIATYALPKCKAARVGSIIAT